MITNHKYNKMSVDLRYIQELLEHNSPKTTEIYAHVSKRVIDKIKNPTDDFFEFEGKVMIKEEYTQLCLTHQFGRINTIEFIQTLCSI